MSIKNKYRLTSRSYNLHEKAMLLNKLANKYQLSIKKIAQSLNEQNKPKLYFLIGPPAVGKSTWINSNLPSDVVVVNRDDMVEKIAKESGVGSYDDMFTRPPQEITPPGMISKEIMENPETQNIVDDYIQKVAEAAEKFNNDPNNKDLIQQFGELIPFSKKDFEQVLVKFGVKPQFITPFQYEKIKQANDNVSSLLDATRANAAKQNQSIAIDMANMSINERNQHRKFLLNSLNHPSNDPSDINQYYQQIAIVFSPESGYSPELIEKIKNIANIRAQEIKSKGGSKTIPSVAYDRMFASFSPPSPEEGFSNIMYVDVPSLLSQAHRYTPKLFKLANYISLKYNL